MCWSLAWGVDRQTNRTVNHKTMIKRRYGGKVLQLYGMDSYRMIDNYGER